MIEARFCNYNKDYQQRLGFLKVINRVGQGAYASGSDISGERFASSSVFGNNKPNGSSRNHLPSPLPRHLSRPARRLAAPRLSIAGEGKPFLIACSSKRTAQKSETHPPCFRPLCSTQRKCILKGILEQGVCLS